MRIFDVLLGKGKKDNKPNNSNPQDKISQSDDILDKLLRTGKYAKTPEEKQEIQRARELRNRIKNLKIKKYKDARKPSYNNDSSKKRLEVGSSFKMNNLPGVLYDIAKHSGELRSAIGGRFTIKDRDKLKFIIRHKGHTVRKMDQRLNHKNEKKRTVILGELF